MPRPSKFTPQAVQAVLDEIRRRARPTCEVKDDELALETGLPVSVVRKAIRQLNDTKAVVVVLRRQRGLPHRDVMYSRRLFHFHDSPPEPPDEEPLADDLRAQFGRVAPVPCPYCPPQQKRRN